MKISPVLLGLAAGAVALVVMKKKKPATNGNGEYSYEKPEGIPAKANYKLAVVQDQSCGTCGYAGAAESGVGGARESLARGEYAVHCSYWKTDVSANYVCDYWKAR